MPDPSFALLALQEYLPKAEPYVAYGFGQRDYFNQTNMYPVGVVVLVMSSLLMLTLRRSQAILALFLLMSVVPTSQRFVIAGLDWDFGRTLILVGLIRILFRSEYRGLRWNKLDKVFAAWAITLLVVYTVRRASVGALTYRAGVTLEAAGMYYLARAWIRDKSDIDGIGRFIAWLSIPTAFLFWREFTTGTNAYDFVGGVGQPEIREGRVRAGGPFEHPILAGCFWVSLMPWVVVGWWTRRRERLLTIAGVASMLTILVCSSSSTPIGGFAAALMAACFYPLRRHLRQARWAALFTVVVLHLVMSKPVWHLIARVGVIGGSTGYHRYRLIDAAVNNWKGWILLGTKSTAGWGWYLFDITNQYVKEAVDGGGLGLVLFVWYFSLAFKYLGQLVRSEPRLAGRARWWALGVSLFAQCVMFIGIGITHAEQNFMVWIVPIGAISGLWQFRGQERPAPAPAPSRAAPARRPVRLWHERSARARSGAT